MSSEDPASESAAVTARGLRMRYGAREALRGIDLAVPTGVVFGIVGPNGAGKTTTLEILEGHRRRSSGHVSVLGVDPARGGRRLRERIGILLQEGGIEPDLTVSEAVDATRGYYPRPLARADLLEVTGLTEQLDVRVRRLSTGQRRRLGLALALAGDPELLFLDEPTVGFDPQARRDAWDAIRRFVSSGRTVVLATNVMEEAQALADRVAILVAGRVVADGTPVEVVGQGGPGSAVRFRLPVGGPALPPELTRSMAAARDDFVELRTHDPASLIHKLGAWAVRNDVTLGDLVVAPRSLEDAYLELTSKAAMEAAQADGSHPADDPITPGPGRGRRRAGRDAARRDVDATATSTGDRPPTSDRVVG